MDFGDIRSILGRGPSALTWRALCEAIEEWPDGPEAPEFVARVLPYVQGHLRSWDPSLCVAPKRWMDELTRGRARPYMRIARALDFSGRWIGPASVGPLGEILEDFEIVSVDLTRANIKDAGMRKLVEQPFIRGVRALRLKDNQITRKGLRAIMRSENLSRLQKLDLGGNALSSEMMQELLEAHALTGLEELRLDGCRMRGAGVERLVEAPFFPRLHTLTLKEAQISNSGLRALSRAPLDALRRLDLSQNGFSSNGARYLAESHQLRGLKELRLNGCMQMGSVGFDAFARSEHLVALEVLHAAGSRLDTAAIAALSESRSLGSLRSLDLRGSNLRDDAAAVLAVTPFSETLERLRLDGCYLRSGAGEGVLDLASMPSLRELGLDNNVLGVRAWKKLCGEDVFPSIERLDARACGFGEGAFDALRDAPWSSRLRELALDDQPLTLRAYGVREGAFENLESLSLQNCGLDAAQITALTRREDFPALRRLDLSRNTFTMAEARALARCRWLGQLESLALQNCRMDDDTMFALCDSPHLTSLHALDLTGNWSIGAAGASLAKSMNKLSRMQVDLS